MVAFLKDEIASLCSQRQQEDFFNNIQKRTAVQVYTFVRSMNIAGLLYDTSKQFSSKEAIIENGQGISYKDLWSKIEELSAAFYKIGVRENSRVALILPNSSDFVYCFFALLKNNAIVAPLSPELTPFEFKSIFHNLNPHAIIAIPIFIEKVFHENPSLFAESIIISRGETVIPVRRSYQLSELYHLTVGQKIGISETDENQSATISYTYRGFGYPLGAVLSHKNYFNGAAFYINRTELNRQHRVLSILPTYHVFPLMGGIIAPLLSGATVVIINSYIISHILRTIDKYKVSQLLAVPSLYYLLLKYTDRNRHDMISLKSCITGGDYMSAEVQEEISRKLSVDVLQGYGLTECLPVTCNPPSKNKLGSLGPPGRHDVKIKIVGENGTDKAPGEIGEILISGPTVMSGYYGLDDETRRVLADGWLYTGDYGYLDSEGYLYFTGCKKNIVKVGGKLVDPREIQNVLLSHPLVSDVFIYSKGDSLWGNIIVAEVASHGDGKLTEDEIISFCRKRLSRYKIPKEINFVTEVTQR